MGIRVPPDGRAPRPLRSRRGRSRWLATVLATAVLGTAMPVRAEPDALMMMRRRKKKRRAKKGPEVTPEMAAARRQEAEQRIQAIVAADPVAAGRDYDNAAAEWGDPVLFLDAGDAYLAAAKKNDDPEMAAAAEERGHIALDILYFHLDPGADEGFRLVEGTAIPGLISRADDLVAESHSTAQELEQAATTEATPAPEPRRVRKPMRPGTGKLIAGAILTSAGAAAAGIGLAGLGLGASRQHTAEDPTVYGPAYDAVAAKGKNANIMAYVGLPVGAVLLGTGVALVVLGVRARKKAGPSPADEKPGDGPPPPPEPTVSLTPVFGPRLGGLSLSGRF